MIEPTFNGPMDPVYPCREMPTRHCPAVYDAVCEERPCARFESKDNNPWYPELLDNPLYPKAVENLKLLTIKFKKLCSEAQMPTYAHPGDAGMDLYSVNNCTVWAYHKAIISTGIAMEIPEGYFGMIRPRSGLAVKYGITATSSGVIDSGYRGEVKVLLHNLGTQSYEIKIGDRIAQLLILPTLHAVLEEADELSETSRGKSGHGSTGK